MESVWHKIALGDKESKIWKLCPDRKRNLPQEGEEHPYMNPGGRRTPGFKFTASAICFFKMDGTHQKNRLSPLNKILLPCLPLLLALAIGYEMKANVLEAAIFSWYLKGVTWNVQDGESQDISFPLDGPFDISRGYTRIPNFQRRLKDKGYVIVSQARQSKRALFLCRNDIPIPYDKKDGSGLRLIDKHGTEAYRANLNTQRFTSFQSIPPLLVTILLHRENRELFNFERPFMNPAIEWDRFSLACFKYIGEKLFGISGKIGGSTLATQTVKFRHSSMGMTRGPLDKMKQMMGASLWSYQKGPDTIDVRKEIVKEYLNGMPLGAASGYGEINGIGNGMWIWFGKTIDQLIADLQLDETNQDTLYKKAKTLKEALSLIIATQHPSSYLKNDPTVLEEKVNSYLSLLEADGIISAPIKKAALTISLQFRQDAPIHHPGSFVERKGTNAIRTKLLDLLGLTTLYELDRLDLTVDTTLDFETQQKVNNILNSLYDPAFLRQHGFLAPYLLNKGCPEKVIYSFALFESHPEGNLIRILADTLDKPLNIATGTRLELGSTAKLRALASYLMAIDHLDDYFAEKDREGLTRKKAQIRDPLSKWVLEYRLHYPDATRGEILKASLRRTISASPYQIFFTGGGIHLFKNFKKDQDDQFFTVEEAFRQSVNLVFIRLMKELVDYHIANLGYDMKTLLSEKDNPERLLLLKEAAEIEALEFLKKYYQIHATKTYDESFEILCQSPKHPLRNWVILSLKKNTDATFEQLVTAAKSHFQESVLNLSSLNKLFKAHRGKSYCLTDEAYLLGKHPLELWMVFYLKDHPGAPWDEIIEESKEARILSSSWLFKTRFHHAQNLRIKAILERKAFAEIHQTWRSLGYPFKTFVPTLATVIGSSADRPVNLAELTGIILNEGIYRPTIGIKALHFAQGTPYETHFAKTPDPEKRVMSPEEARVLKDALRQVVENGTARRIRDLSGHSSGTLIDIGGKTGTGDNQFRTFRKGAEIISSKVTSRTSTFVFYVDRFFGVVMAHTEGPEASQYEFTSALAVQVLKTLWPVLEPVFQPECSRKN